MIIRAALILIIFGAARIERWVRQAKLFPEHLGHAGHEQRFDYERLGSSSLEIITYGGEPGDLMI